MSEFRLDNVVKRFSHCRLQAALAALSTRQACNKENLLPHPDHPAASAQPAKHQPSRPRGKHEKWHFQILRQWLC